MFASFNLFGWLEIYLLPIFLILAAFWGTFVFYRLVHKRAAYKEFDVFDCFLLSLFLGFVAGRASFIALNYDKFLGDWWRYLNFLAYPGIAVFIAIFTCSFFLWMLLRRRKIKDLELLDYWARATCLGLVFYQLGLFLDGSGGGYLTDSFLGLKFPGLDAKVHPTQLYSALFYTVIFFILAHIEKNYRTYLWYRGSRSAAKTGFVFITFLFCYSLFSLIMLIFQPPTFTWRGIIIDWVFYLIILALGLILLGRGMWNPKKKI